MWAFSLVVKLLVKTVTGDIQLQLLDSNFHPGKPWEAVVMTEVIGFLPPTWEAWIALPAPGFGRPQPWAIEGIWRVTQ